MAEDKCLFDELVAIIKARIAKESSMIRSERAKAAWEKRKKRLAMSKDTPKRTI
jgi:hypothetical protein